MDKISTVRFGDWLNKKLEIEGWSMTTLAKRAGASKQVISKYINQPPEKLDLNILRGIAYAFGMDFIEILRIAGIVDPVSEEQSKIDKITFKVKYLNSENYEDVLDYIDSRLKKQETKEKNDTNKTSKKTSSREKKSSARSALKEQ
jgi:transcriptional regulator with XRE-family HTH domain